MSRLFYHTCQDNAGNLLFDVTGTMRLAGSGTLATIYGDEALTVILPNPMTNHPSFGSFKCFLGSGDYDFYLSKSGYTFETLTGVQGHGTMAQQDASAVAITGGTAVLQSVTSSGLILTTGGFQKTNAPGDGNNAFYTDQQAAGGAGRYAFFSGGNAESHLSGPLTIGTIAGGNANLGLDYDKSLGYGIRVRPRVNDAGVGAPVLFENVAATIVGYISTTATATAYNTTSDVRLKHAITPLTGALDVVQRLRPITHLWNADDSRGYGFRAHELQREIPDAVTGEPDAVDAQGNVQPQQVDHSKLVPWLVGALQTLLVRVEVLEAHVSGLYAQLEP